ncbi:protein cortex-like isoform X2 [Colias croceus]|uniref:protein cortex-like isoform X2 n=1 Tax=Colias crocea TaxID=72248 RepID=UPI001E27BA4B|nr:protein cortex-like isoform X2 [Colias croceus]
MERITFRKKSLNRQSDRVDRFVHTRESVSDPRRRRSLPDCQAVDGDAWITKYKHQKSYGDSLDRAFGVEQESDKYVVQPWPCVPRKKSYLTPADSILDLPEYSYADFAEILDWSSDNILVAALGRNYHKWSWGSQNLTGQGFAMQEIMSCKFDPRGELLMLGTDKETVEIHDNANSKCIAKSRCFCNLPQPELCAVIAVDWSPTGNSYVTGCTGGMVASFTRTCNYISLARHVRKPIFSVRISPDARFVAVTTINSTQVMLLSWPYLDLISCLDFNKAYTNLVTAWHPWRSALLGIGAVTSEYETKVVMCEAPTGKVKKSTLGGSKYYLDAMLFSSRTGELVLSLFNIERGLLHPKTSSQLVVLSNPETVVDQWCDDGRTGLDRVRTMVFSPDGTKLATATSDEDLIIWNFLPEDKNIKKTQLRRFSAIPVYMDQVTQGYALR